VTDETARILWRRLDRPGHEFAELRQQESTWLLIGVALFDHDKQPCRLEYQITCDQNWSTLSAKVAGQVGKRSIEVKISAGADGTWRLNDELCAPVAGCKDVDLNFSPSTNLLPVQRLNLRIGQESTVRAAWLRFPSFALEPLEQTYRRISKRTYRYESAGGKFVAELQVHESGFPLQYGNIWSAEAVV